MTTALGDLFQHNLWANRRLIDFCAELDDDVLDATVHGTYGTIRATLMHIIGAELRYITLLRGEEMNRPPLERTPFPGFAGLRELAQQSGAALAEIAATVEPGRMLTGERFGEPYSIPAAVPLAQAVHHGSDHRSQIATILTQQGIEPPDIDVWTFNEARSAGEG